MDLSFGRNNRRTRVTRRDLELVTGIDEVAQRIFFALDMQRGEYAFDLRAGFPWRELVYVKRPDFRAIEAELVRVVRAADARIVKVDQVVFDFDQRARRLGIRFRAVTDLGELDVSTAPIALDAPTLGIVVSWSGGTYRGGVFPG